MTNMAIPINISRDLEKTLSRIPGGWKGGRRSGRRCPFLEVCGNPHAGTGLGHSLPGGRRWSGTPPRDEEGATTRSEDPTASAGNRGRLDPAGSCGRKTRRAGLPRSSHCGHDQRSGSIGIGVHGRAHGRMVGSGRLLARPVHQLPPGTISWKGMYMRFGARCWCVDTRPRRSGTARFARAQEIRPNQT